jgi:hypothetical protein
MNHPYLMVPRPKLEWVDPAVFNPLSFAQVEELLRNNISIVRQSIAEQLPDQVALRFAVTAYQREIHQITRERTFHLLALGEAYTNLFLANTGTLFLDDLHDPLETILKEVEAEFSTNNLRVNVNLGVKGEGNILPLERIRSPGDGQVLGVTLDQDATVTWLTVHVGFHVSAYVRPEFLVDWYGTSTFTELHGLADTIELNGLEVLDEPGVRIESNTKFIKHLRENGLFRLLKLSH